MSDDSPSKPNVPIRARRWKRPQSTPLARPYRFAVRLIGIPAAAVAGLLIWRGLQDHFVLPKCDSDRAKQTLTEVLTELRLVPTRYEPIKTELSGKDEVVCSADLPLPDGGTVALDYTFYWDGGTAHMKYSAARHAPDKPPSP